MADAANVTPPVKDDKAPQKPKSLVPDEDGLVTIEGFTDTRVGQDYEYYQPQDNRVDRIAVLPSLVLITEANVVKIKELLGLKIGQVVKKPEEVDGKTIEAKYYRGHLFKAANIHYTDRGHFRCLGKGKICCQLTGKDPQLSVPVPVLKYPTNKDGQISVKDINEIEWEIQIWKLNEATFGKLRTTEKEFPLWCHDIKVAGKKRGKYVAADTITPCAECVWQKWPPEKVEALAALAASIYDTKLNRHLGRRLKEEEIRELFGQAPSNPKAADASSGVEVGDLVSGL